MSGAAAAILVLGLPFAVFACGERAGSQARGAATSQATVAPAAAEGTVRGAGSAASAAPDAARPADVQVFETSVDTKGPKRVTLRLLVLHPHGEAGLSEALRLVLDSLTRAHRDLVAARAVAYAPVPRGPRQADLVPVAWGAWVPPEGWDSAAPSSRIHRTYVYVGTPPDPLVVGASLEN